MATNSLVDKHDIEIKIGSYGVANAKSVRDPSILPKVQEYRRMAGGRLYPLNREDIHRKIPTADFLVSRKIDGEFTVLYFDKKNLFTMNPGGTVRMGLPWQEEAAKLLKKSGWDQAMIAGELHVAVDGRRARVHDVVSVARQPDDQDELKDLRFSVFDIIEIDESPYDQPFSHTRETIEKVFEKGKLIKPVQWKQTDSTQEIEELFEQWVETDGEEGIVARSDSAGMFKIKPLHTLDVVVIGFTESTDERTGMLHDLLLAVARADGALQVLGTVGGGFSEDERRDMLSDLKDMVVESEFAQVNSDHVAYQMVRPEWVIEISCLDMISHSTRGTPVSRMALNWNKDELRYEVIRRLPLVSMISPQFVRRREDKTVNPQDIRIDQIASVVEVPMSDRKTTELSLPKSEVLRREVFTKTLKGATMVRKFMMWKTNKETESSEFPGYVFHFTDYSPNRKVPLARDVRVSNSLDQMEAIWNEFQEENIKKGWAAVE